MGERRQGATVRVVAWLFWLLVPVVAGTLTSVWAWWLERPRRRPDTRGAIRAHDRYLETLAPAETGFDGGADRAPTTG